MTGFHQQLLRAAWRRRVVILIVTVTFAVIGGVRALMTDTFAAETRLLITSVPLTTPSQNDGVLGIIPTPFNARVYEHLANSNDVVGKTLERLAEARAFQPDGPPLLHVFREFLSAQATTVDETTRPQTFSPLLRMEAQANTAELAITILDTWVDVTIEAVRTADRKRVAAAKVILEQTRDEQLAHLRATWAEIEAAQTKNMPALLMDEMRERVSRLVQRGDRLGDAQTDLSSARERLASSEQDLAHEPEFLELGRAPTDTAYWIAEAASSGSSLEEMVMVSQESNPVYLTLRESVTGGRATVAALQAEVDEIARLIRENADTLAQTRADYATLNAEMEGLEARESFQERSYLAIAELNALMGAAYNLTSITNEDGSTAVGLNRIGSTVYASKASTGPGGRGLVVIMGALGFLLSLTLVLLPVVLMAAGKSIEQPASGG